MQAIKLYIDESEKNEFLY